MPNSRGTDSRSSPRQEAEHRRAFTPGRKPPLPVTLGGIFLPVIMPIVAHVTTPQPPADTVLQYSGDDARCYSAGYSDAASGKRKKGAWIGSATAIGLFVVLVTTAGRRPEQVLNAEKLSRRS